MTDAHSRAAAAGSSSTVTSLASAGSIEAGTCGSGLASAPNAAATASAFAAPEARNTTARARGERRQRQRDPRHERLETRPRDADHEP